MPIHRPTIKRVSGAIKQEVLVNTPNGFGSTNTRIRRFTNLVISSGSAITYADSSTLGSTFTINEAGSYAINYVDRSSATGNLGISLNSTALSTGIVLIDAEERLAISTQSASAVFHHLSFCGYFEAGDIIRAQSDTAMDFTGVQAHFRVTKIGD